ncbi:putative ribonuclease H-like domain-containing protein [Tanacetum coccineum]
MTHPHPNRRFVPQAVLTRSGKINTAGASLNTAGASVNSAGARINIAVRPVNTTGSKPIVNHPRSISNTYKKGYSQVKRPFNTNKNSCFNKKVNTVRVKDTTARYRAVVSKNKGKGANVVKASACWGNPQQKEYKEKGVIDSDGKGRISGKGKIKTGTLDFENVYFCKELKYNLFSVSQICDKKNNVLFTDTECLVLSSDFKLLDESQVLLRVPRKDNIYSVDLKSVVPTKGLTCLFAKATIDESNLWHRRLGHINFKNMNKLVRGNLVRGLPSKIFENDHSCVACQKGKQHKASCKTKLVNSISKPLHMLHMDLFGPTNVKSLMKKSYCLVVTDDFSRFSWVFFLATKDETSGILKTFITKIENQLDHKVKVIRCDNGTEFKNSNDVAERRNRTLIEAARTMLVDSKLPTTFWAEAVNTACYVLNRVLVIKHHNKTPYELIHGRTPLIDFMKPFGCPVTILNTRDQLGKFDGKANEGFFVGNSVVSKAMRLFNKRTRIVEETLNIRFLENASNVTGNGLDWLLMLILYPKVSEEDAKENTTEMDESGASDKDGEDDQATRISTAVPSCTDDDLSSLVNAAEASNAFEEHLFEQFSPFKNAFTLPPVLNVTPMNDTEIFVLANCFSSTLEDGEVEIIATIDGQLKTITEVSLRRHLKLEDADGISSLPNAEIFEQLALMGMLVQGPTQQGEGSTVLVESHHTPITTPPTSQPLLSSPYKVPILRYDLPLPGMASLEQDLKQTKKVYGNAYTKLIMRVKKLEHKVKSRQPRRARVVISDTKEDLEDPSKQGRRIAKIDQNPSISLGEKEISTANISVSTTSATPKVSTAAKNLVYIRRSAKKRIDKGKAIMKEDESVQKKAKKQLEQERLGHEEAIRLQEQINEEERQRIDRDAKIAKQLQEEFNRARQEQEVVAEADQAHDID